MEMYLSGLQEFQQDSKSNQRPRYLDFVPFSDSFLLPVEGIEPAMPSTKPSLSPVLDVLFILPLHVLVQEAVGHQQLSVRSGLLCPNQFSTAEFFPQGLQAPVQLAVLLFAIYAECEAAAIGFGLPSGNLLSEVVERLLGDAVMRGQIGTHAAPKAFRRQLVLLQLEDCSLGVAKECRDVGFISDAVELMSATVDDL
jgi:hypothetical protein